MFTADQCKIVNGTYYHPQTPDEIITILERVRLSKTRIRFYYGDVGTGRSWLEEHDIQGRVGRSLGPVKIPILLANSRSLGGGGILTHCLIKIREAKGGEVLYQHPSFHAGEMKIQPSDLPDYSQMVVANGSVHARFRNAGQATRWIQRMQ